MIVGETSTTFAGLDRAAGGIAAALAAVGTRRGDRVLVVADGSPEVVAALFAISRLGAAFAVVAPGTTESKLAAVIRDAEPVAVVAGARSADQLGRARRDAGGRRPVLWTAAVPDPVSGDVDLAAVLAEETVAPPPVRVIDADLAAILYTSGSTGEPKGVALTHRNVCHSTGAIATYLGLRADDVVGSALPLAFSYGLFHAFLAARVGFTLALEPSFVFPLEVMRRLVRLGTTVFPGVPTLFAGLLANREIEHVDLSSVRIVTNAAAALPPAFVGRLRSVFPRARIFAMYGQTECTRISYLEPDRLDDKPGSVGRAMPNTEAYVVDDEGRRVGPGVVGELVVRGASVMAGYWRRPEETAAVLREGPVPGERVLHTGDLFRGDDEGDLHFVGRRDDVFKCRGEKVSPVEVESALVELDDVLEAAVVGIPDDVDGTAVKAVIVRRPGSSLDERDVVRHCRSRLERHLVPSVVEFRPELPTTDSGKVARRELG